MMLLPLLFAVAVGRDEEDLVRRLQKRDPQALGELYDRCGRLVYAVILRVVKEPAIAEDLTQETFLRVWNRAGHFDAARGSIGPWLLAVARNRAIDYLRSLEGRERRNSALEDTENPALFGDMERDILISDQARRVREAIGQLSPNYRSVVELAYFEGLTQSEMAERLGQPLGTVKTWVRAALSTLRESMAGGAIA